MKQPRPRGAAIDANRLRDWLEDFSEYRYAVSESRIERWLNQFGADYRNLAARVLDCVDFVSRERISTAFRSLLNGLPGWSPIEGERTGKWRFVPFSVSAGESGDALLYDFRLANGLDSKKYNELFVHMRDLLRENLGSDDTVVFVDDFAGTGDQVCGAWVTDMAELLSGGPNTYLLLVASSRAAREAISSSTNLTVVRLFELDDSDNIFSDMCPHFDAGEKAALLVHCKKADRRNPKGYGECGFVVVFTHRCPNNTIPILHANHENWVGLFRRHH